MRRESKAMRLLHILLRPGLALALTAAQFLGGRETLFTANRYLLALGVLLMGAGVFLWIAASLHCSKARDAGEIATTGPYRVIRHPIYASVILLTAALGCVFFTWLHFLVLAAFTPLWWVECRSEEEEMMDRFGEAYAAYRERTPMLVPGLFRKEIG